MRLLDRLIIRSFLKIFLVAVLATPALFIIGEISERLDDYLDAGLTLIQIATGLLYRVPEFIAWSFPIGGLIAAVFTIHGMTANREIVAAKAGGVSFHRLMLPILTMGVLIAGLGLYLAEFVPVANRQAAEILAGDRPNFGREGRFDFAFRSEAGMDMSIQRLSVSEGRLTGIIAVQEFDSSVVHVEAERATYENGVWFLNAGNRREVFAGGGEHFSRFDRLEVSGFTETPDDLLGTASDPDEMTRPEIERQARIVARSGGAADELLVKLEQRYAIPAATLVIILFGAPLATSNKRGGAAWGIGVALASTILYMLLLRLSGGFGTAGLISPVWAAWTPNLLFFLSGSVLLARVRT